MMAPSSRQRSAPAALLLLLAATTALLAPRGASAAAATSTAAECEALGFVAPVCSDCDQMAEYVKDEALVGDCRKCCVKQAEGDAGKYTHARLTVCPFRLNGLPAIQDFIDKHAAKWGKALTVERTMNAYPQLKLSHAKTKASTSVRIDNWRQATINEYLTDKLESSSSSKSKAANVATSK